MLTALLVVSIFALPIDTVASSKNSASKIRKNQILYTQHSLYYEDNRFLTTNYLKGTLLPINSEVKFTGYNAARIVVTLPDGQDLFIVNIENFTKEDIHGIFSRTLAETPADLSQFTEDEKQSIMLGEVKIGMSKSAVIAAIGYPPKHKTPNLQMNQWIFWKNRFVTTVISFDNEKVVNIR
jgi:hypothetical protein